MKVGDYMIVKDANNKITLIHGKISKITNNPAGYSVDNILFINPNSKKFIITRSEKPLLEQVYNVACESDNYITYKHNNIDNTFEYDFFMWNEIEPEVKETVDLLNQLDFVKTYSSCSGHGKIPSYIDFHILNYEKFFVFLHFLNKHGIHSYCDKHGELKEDYKIRFIVGVEEINTCHLELVEIYSNFDKLNDLLKLYIKIDRNRNF